MTMEIEAKSEIIRGMAGEVKYYTSACPFGSKEKVGSTGCKLCKHHGGMTDEVVTCNHE